MYRSIARPLLIVGALALLSACGQKAETSSPPAAPSSGDTTAGPTAPSTPDFVEKAGGSDMYEIQAAQIAGKRSHNADIKAFAKMMITDHTKSTNDLKAAITASSLSLSPPAMLPADLQSKIDALNAAQASDFDKAYIDQQVDAHQDALDLVQRYANNGDTPAVKTFASNLVTVIQGHLDKARTIQAGLGSAAPSSAPTAK